MNRLRPPRAGRAGRLVAAVVAAATVLAACGGGSEETAQSDDIVALFASYDLAVGTPSRVLVGVQSADNRLLAYGTASFRFAFVGTQEAPVDATYGAPVPARYLPVPGVEVPTPPPAQPALVLPSEARGVYAAETTFDRAGFWEVELTATVGGREQSATAAFEVLPSHRVPAVGDRAPATDNHTIAAGPDVPPVAIDSRHLTTGVIPDPELHQDKLDAVLAAGRPAVVVISTPVYCRSQFCGPITEMVSGLAADYANRASFIHLEVWRDFNGLVANKAAAGWIQASDFNEPWVFLVGGDGVVKGRWGNVATRGEIEPLLQALPVLGPPQ